MEPLGQALQQLERRRPKEPTNQLSLFGGPPASSGTSPGAEGDTPSATPPPDALREALRALDVDALAPRQALEALYRLRDLAL